jgi:hypothetical protein
LLLLGARRLNKLKSLRKKETKKTGKEFSVEDVKAICERIEAVARNGRAPIRVDPAHAPSSLPASRTHHSIRISR